MGRDQEADQRVGEGGAELRYYKNRPVLLHSTYRLRDGTVEAVITNLKGKETNIVPARKLKRVKRLGH